MHLKYAQLYACTLYLTSPVLLHFELNFLFYILNSVISDTPIILNKVRVNNTIHVEFQSLRYSY